MTGVHGSTAAVLSAARVLYPAHRPARARRAVAGLACALFGLLAAPVLAQNIVQNGDLSRGAGNTPAEFRADQWDAAADASVFTWIAPGQQAPGQASIRNKQPNDARFVQDLQVREQTWYRIEAEVRTEDVGQEAIGAYLSLMEGYRNSEDVKGSQRDWVPLVMWVKSERGQDRLQLALRLGGYGSPNTGQAWFRSITAVPVLGPAANAKHVYPPLERGRGIAPLGVFGLMLVLSLIAAGLWHYLRRSADPEDRGTPKERLMLALLLFVTLAAKVLLAPHFGFGTDMGTYTAWAARLADVGPANFYAPDTFSDYPPGYLYILWVVGKICRLFDISLASGLAQTLIKAPAFATDLLTSALLYVLLRPRAGARLTWIIVLVHTLNPAVVFNSAIWGQTDSFFTLELFLGVTLLLRNRIALGWALIALAALTKPQALIFLPLLASWRGNWTSLKQVVIAAATGLGVAALLTLPFLPLLALHEHYTKGAAYYAETSVNAFNLMALLGGFRQPDSGMLGFMNYQSWAFAFVLIFFAYLGWLLVRRRDAEMIVYLSFLLPFGFFMLSTRMHERYLFPCLIFALILTARRPRMWVLYGVMTVTFTLNQWYVLRALNAQQFLDRHDPFGVAISLINVGLFAYALFEGWQLSRSAPEPLPLPSELGR